MILQKSTTKGEKGQETKTVSKGIILIIEQRI